MAVTRIKNNQVTDSSSGNTQVGINAGTKLQDFSITAGKIANNLTYGSDLTVTGNLTVQGNSTAIDTTITTIEDPIIVLASTQTSGAPTVDIGFLGYRGNESNIAFVWDESADSFVTAFTSTGESNTTITITSYANLQIGNLSLTGNILNNTLNVTGNITGGNLLTPGLISATSTITSAANITGGNILTAGLISTTSTITSAANITGGNILTAGLISATSTITSSANIAGGNLLTAGLISATSTITSSANITGGNVLTGGVVSATANVTGGNVLTGGLISATSTITSAANITGGNLLTGGLISSTGAVTSGGFTTTGNVTGGNILFGSGQVSGTGNVYAANFIGNISGNIDAAGANTQVQFNDGDLLGASAAFTFDKASNALVNSGNVTGGNLLTGGIVSATANITGGNVLTAGLISATGNITGGNANIIGTTASTSRTTGALKVAGGVGVAGDVYAGNSVVVDGGAYGNVTTTQFASVFGAGAGPNPYSVMQVRSSDGVSGLGMQAFTGSGTLYGNTGINFVTGATIRDRDVYSGGTTRAYLDSAGLSVTGIVSASGNVTGGNILTGGLISATGTITSAANITGANINTAGLITATGNITGGNLLTPGLISAAGLATSGNVQTAGYVSAAGNVYADNVITDNVISSGALFITTGANGSINLTPNGTGNIVLANTYVNSVRYPVQDQDAASKIYVDNLVSTSISYHDAVYVATTTTLSTATGGTITYNQPNGAANGVGATLTTTGSFNLIDTGNVQTANTRILVKDEANAAHNGVYVWSNATVITRSSDTDTYGAGNAFALGLNDYFFVQDGNVNQGSAWIVDSPTGTITFGTSLIDFAQFSSSQTYTANTAAGLTLISTEFNAKVDNNTTAFDVGGNIIVKAGANLTTPNIGAATGTSLSLTGNVTSGNVVTSGFVTATGNVAGGNVTTVGLVTATGNVTGGNILTAGLISATSTITSAANISGGNVLTGGVVSATANITGGNLLTAGLVSATGTITSAANITGGNITTAGLITATGNVTGGNVNTAGVVTATGNVTGGNILTGGLISATSTITSAANITGGNVLTGGLISATSTITSAANITGGNLLTGGLISATSSITSAANIIGGNISTAGLITATGNVTGGNILTAGLISATSNITGGNLLYGSGIVSGTGNVYAANFIGNISGNIDAGGANTQIQFNDSDVLAGSAGFTFNKTSNAVVANGNITGSNFTTAGLVTATGNVTGGNVLTGGLISATSTITSAANITGGNLLTGGLISATSTITSAANVIGGNISTAGLITATGNITGGNVRTGGLISATANITGANLILTTGLIDGPAAGRITINGSDIDTDFAVDGDTVANVFYVDAGTGTASFGASTQVTNAIVNFATTTSIKAPVGNTAQRPGTGVTGMLRFNTTSNALEVYDNSAWTSVGVPVFTVIADEQFAGDGSTVAFTLGSTQTTNSCIVSINGVVQIPTLAYAVAGTNPTCVLTFTEAPASGDVIDVREITTTTTVTSIANSSGNAVVAVSDTAAQVNVTGDLSVSGSILGGNINSTAITNGTSNVAVVSSGGNVTTSVGGTSNVMVVSSTDVTITGNLTVTGNATLSGNILGDRIQNGTTIIDVQSAGGNANITVGGVANIAQFTSTSLVVGANILPTANITYDIGSTGQRFKDLWLSNSTIYLGNAQFSANATALILTNPAGGQTVFSGATPGINVTGNVTGGNITTAGLISATGNITGGNIRTAGLISATGSITTGGDISITGNIVDGAALTISTSSNGNITLAPNGSGVVVVNTDIRNGQANATGNIGATAARFNTVFALATSAQYADLAEKYAADAEYAPGTVVAFGGTAEVTLCVNDGCSRVAGVISTNPSYRMNDGLVSEHTAMVALTGRVPTSVTGTVRKGDMMVSAGAGRARAEANPAIGTVIGKALEDHDGADGVIEVVVGRV